VVESTQQRDSSRHAATATDFEAHPPPSLAVRRLSEDRAARSLTRGPSGPARGILTGWGFPHCVRETSLTRPTDRLCGPVSVSATGISHTHHTPVSRALPCRTCAQSCARSLLFPQAAVSYVGLRRGLPAEQYIETLLGALFPHGAGLRREQDCPALVFVQWHTRLLTMQKPALLRERFHLND